MTARTRFYLRQRVVRGVFWLQALLMASVSIYPALTPSHAYAATQLPNRQASVTTSQASAPFNITFEFDTPSGGAIQGMEFEFCDQPLGTCTTAGTPTLPASPGAMPIAGWTNSTAFAAGTREGGDSGGSANQIYTTRTQAAAETSVDKTVTINNLTNNSQVNTSYYIRIRLYSTTTRLVGAMTWEGVVAQSTAAQLTISARVQERLDFCVGTTAVVDDTTSPATDCSAITGNTVDLGIIDSSTVNVSPVATGSGGNSLTGIAMIRTNAAAGATISYVPEQNTSSGSLKVAGATCSGTDTTDQCFNDAGTSGTTAGALEPGAEGFGMTISHVNTGSKASSYTGANLVRDAAYDGDGSTGGSCAGNGVVDQPCWLWNGSTTLRTIATSSGSSVKVIDDEALILRFAATAGVTTPTGQYTVMTTYIATATF